MSPPCPPLSVAPMLDHTDRFFRRMLRHITRRTLLYTEMVTTNAILRGDRHRALQFDAVERPLALQLGGDDPAMLAECARMAVDLGYDEINLNVGCPSERVQSGCFGAILMRRPAQVARCVEAMKAAVPVPVTVKHRIGVDELDRYEDMRNFVDVVARSGADRFTVHARKAWLSGLSPAQNRTVPPLRHPEVWRLKEERPDLAIEINGGVLTLDQAAQHLQHVDGVMIGRAVLEDPWMLRPADARFFGGEGEGLAGSRRELVERLARDAERMRRRGERLQFLARHLLGLFSGQPGARAWRRHLTLKAFQAEAGPGVLIEALELLPPEAG